jgi:hypothetical protein
MKRPPLPVTPFRFAKDEEPFESSNIVISSENEDEVDEGVFGGKSVHRCSQIKKYQCDYFSPSKKRRLPNTEI